MTSIKKLVQGEAGRIYRVKHSDIVVEDGFNKRIDFGDLEDLANSLETNGIRRPLSCFRRGSKIVLDDGERRYRSAGLLLSRGGQLGNGQGDCVPVTFEEEGTRTQRLITQFIQNDGKPFTPIEEAELFSELFNGSTDVDPLSVAEISKAVGKSASHVADRLLLCQADPELLKLLKNKKVGSTLVAEAVKTSRVKGSSAEEAREIQRKIAEVAKKDKNAAKKLAITDATGSFYMKKADQDLLRAAIARCETAVMQEDLVEEARQAGIIMGICQLLGATVEDLESLKIDISQVRFFESK